MNKIFLFVFIFSTLNAGSLLVDTCINDNYYISNSTLYYQEQNTTAYLSTSLSNLENIKSGYVYTSNGCERTLKYGIELKDYNFLMAFSGILIGFTILFLIIWGV